MSISRREFVYSAAGVAAVGLGGKMATLGAQDSPPEKTDATGGPLVISSANGLAACRKAMEMIRNGSDPLDAVVAGVNLVEDDPADHSVGLGGLPNEDGVVELDASVMHGPTHKAGGVAALRNIRNPSRVAMLVMQRTDHVLLVGDGALQFAKAHGFKEEELLTDEARRIWLEWKENHSDRDDWVYPEASEEAAHRLRDAGLEFTYGTINCCCLTAAGDLAGVTTTSGLSYKIPGRVGDSPIIGAGLYVDNDIGAAGSTGRGEANLLNCASFMVVEFMRQGRTPEEAALAVLRRITAKCEKRLLVGDGRPNFGLTFYAVRKDGLIGGASMRGEGKMAYHDGTTCRQVTIPGLFPVRPEKHAQGQ
ncbi:MAG: N(4)-(beta-N-acetylglucosaminyl)-L-asparaginase [Planctomycetes bacterium]|nr:N(4)-(beta-N-acetylglucosaminyl)-L-asparaginase [Planctomycetota bacterium]